MKFQFHQFKIDNIRVFLQCRERQSFLKKYTPYFLLFSISTEAATGGVKKKNIFKILQISQGNTYVGISFLDFITNVLLLILRKL